MRNGKRKGRRGNQRVAGGEKNGKDILKEKNELHRQEKAMREWHGEWNMGEAQKQPTYQPQALARSS